ncbi:MAG: aspartate--tRNA ligase [Patescibacteria group bacterium]|jgi:aspartyl-tRNA synthetase
MLRTHTCGELTTKQLNEEVKLSGWINSFRNLGGLIFIDLRDRYGLTQVKIDPQTQKDLAAQASALHAEWVIQVKGVVQARPQEMVNDKMNTGAIEIAASELKVLSEAQLLPFEIIDEKVGEANEALRLKYRFLDLRRPKLQKMLADKDRFITYLRNYFHQQGFIEVQTPILANSSPEGARDFLVPARLQPGKFYALPQAPQQFKQLLMVGGLDKYFQIAPCFRDEDPRMDRHYGEFYQLDMEMSFVEQEDIFLLMEPLMKELVAEFSQKRNSNLLDNGRFRQISWREALDRYGTDKPDLRYELELQDLSDLVKDWEFKVFSKTVSQGGVVKAIRVPGGAKFSRKELDELTELAKQKGAAGLAYLALKDPEPTGPLAKFLDEQQVVELKTTLGAETGDLLLFVAESWRLACTVLGAIRVELATRLGLRDNSLAAWAWIVDFPMYDYSELETDKIDFAHNPFSMPQGGAEALAQQDPLEILAYQFDLVLNGFEVSSGAIRNHDPKIMYQAFAIAGYSQREVDSQFGAMIKAFSYGAPPHGGNAPGLDRLLMVLNDWDSIRDIYAFPKDGQGRDLMTGAPSLVKDSQVAELGIKVNKLDK